MTEDPMSSQSFEIASPENPQLPQDQVGVAPTTSEKNPLPPLLLTNESTPTSTSVAERDQELFSHPESFGQEGNEVRILAELLFTRTLANRTTSRELLLQEFGAQYMLTHPEATINNIKSSFSHGLVMLEKELVAVSPDFIIPRPKGQNRGSFIKITRQPMVLPIPIETPEPETHLLPSEFKTPAQREKAAATPQIDNSAFGKSKTELLRYLLTSKKSRTLEDISVIRRDEKKSGPVLSKEIVAVKMVIATLQIDLPMGVELRNPLDPEGNAIADSYEVYPANLTIEKIIEMKKRQMDAPSENSPSERDQLQDAEGKTSIELAQNEVLILTGPSTKEEKVEDPRIIELRKKGILQVFEATILTSNENPESIIDIAKGFYPKQKRMKGPLIAHVRDSIMNANRLLKGTGLSFQHSYMNGLSLNLTLWLSYAGEIRPETLEQVLDIIRGAPLDDEPIEVVAMEESVELLPDGPKIQLKPNVIVAIPKTPALEQPEIKIINGKIGVTGDQFESLLTLTKTQKPQGMTPREITSEKLSGRFKARDAAFTERHLEELKKMLAGTPVSISHPANEDGIVDLRRYTIIMPEGTDLRNFVTIL